MTWLNKPQILEHTVFVHACLHTLAQSTGSALVAVRLVHHAAALSLGFAHVLPLPPDGSLEEPGTAATSQNNASSYTSCNSNETNAERERLLLTHRRQKFRSVSPTNGPDTLCMGCRRVFDLDGK